MDSLFELVVGIVVRAIYGFGDRRRHIVQRALFRGAVAALTAAVAFWVLTGADPWSGHAGPVVVLWLVLIAMLMVAEEAIGDTRRALSALLTGGILFAVLIRRAFVA